MTWARRGHTRCGSAAASAWQALCGQPVAVAGARAATAYGTHIAAEFASALATQGWTVISGGAYGIDAAAHRGALAAGGRTVAVLACGPDIAYPREHRAACSMPSPRTPP